MTEVKAKPENAVGKAPRKPRATKPLTPADILTQFQKLPLEDKLTLQAAIKSDIAAEREVLTEKLKLIEGAKA